MDTYDVSPKSLGVLFGTFWSPRGWRHPPQLPSGAALEAAVSAGVMFAHPRELDHNDWVAAARAAAASVVPAQVEMAFIASLGSRRLDLRSALGSYAVARHLPEHAFEASAADSGCCVCGQYPTSSQDLNVLNFERLKWGGVRHTHVDYMAFDLEQFQRAPQPTLSRESIDLGRELLAALRSAAPGETATTMAPMLRMIKGNTNERKTLLDILGLCGVLQTQEHSGYLTSFVPQSDREDPPHHVVERAYPVSWWRGSDGVNEEAVRLMLPTLI